MSIWYKLGEIKDEIAWKTGKVLQATKDSIEDVYDKLEDGVFNAQIKASSLKDDLLFEAKWKARDGKDFIVDVTEAVSDIAFDLKYDRGNVMTNLYERGAVITSEKVMSVMFPATGARLSAQRIQSLDAKLAGKVKTLNGLLEEKDALERKIAVEFENGGMVRRNIRIALQQYAHHFSTLDNEAQYKLKNIETSLNLEMPLDVSGKIQFSKLDSALFKIYDDDFNMLSIFKQSPVSATIIRLREKSLTEELQDCMSEVEQCIEHVQRINQDMTTLFTLTHDLNSELVKTHILLKNEIEKLIALIDTAGSNTAFYGEEEAIIIDNGLMMFGLAVRLLNTPIYSKDEGEQLNEQLVQQVITDSDHHYTNSYGEDTMQQISAQYDNMTSIAYKEGVALISVQKVNEPRSIRRHQNDLLIGYASHYNRGTPTSYALLSETQSYNKKFAEMDVYRLTEQYKKNRAIFNEEHYKAHINQIGSDVDLFTDFTGRYVLFNLSPGTSCEECMLYDTHLKQGTLLNVHFDDPTINKGFFFGGSNLISAAILPIDDNKAEIVIVGYITAYEERIQYASFIYENGQVTTGEGKLKDAIDSVNSQCTTGEVVVNIVPANSLDHFIFETVEQAFIESPFHTARKNVINLYTNTNGNVKLLTAPRQQLLNKPNVDRYVHQFAFDYNNPKSTNFSDNYLYRFLGYGLLNKVTVCDHRMFILDNYDANGSYQLGKGSLGNIDFVNCQQRILEFDIEKDELIASHDIGIENTNIHEILYHNDRLYAIDFTNGLLVYSV